MNRYYAVGVADAYIYADAQKSALIAVGKVLTNTSLEFATSSTEIRGGKRNPLRYTYFHTPDITFTLTDATWNLSLLAKNCGGTLEDGAVVPIEEKITLVGKTGTVTQTPVGSEGGSAYCWYEYNNTAYRATFTNKTFTVDGSIPDNAIVCATYSYTNSGARKLTVPADYIPSIVYVETVQDLASDKAGNGIVGSNIFVIPSAQLSGANTINMTPDGYSETALTMKVNAHTPYGSHCGKDVFCYIIQNIKDVKWYDTAVELAISGDEALIVGETSQLSVYQIKEGYGESSLVPNYADLTFASSATGVATVSASGVVTAISAGSAVITATVTAKTSVKGNISITVTTT